MPSTREPGDLPAPCTPSAGGAPSLTAGLGAPDAGDPCDDHRRQSRLSRASDHAANSRPPSKPSGRGAAPKPNCSPRPPRCAPAAARCSRGAASATCPRPTSPSMTMCWRPPAPSARSLRAMAGRARARPSSPPSSPWRAARAAAAAERAAGIPADCARARDDQVVRHQLPLPRAASCRAAHPLPPVATNRWAELCGRALAQGTRTRRSCSARSPSCCWQRPRTARDPLDLLPRCCRPMPRCCASSPRPGAAWVQIDEPCLVTDLPAGRGRGLSHGLSRAGRGCAGLDLLLATYFGALGDNLRSLPACRSPACTSTWCARAGAARRRAGGAADGRLALARRGGRTQRLAQPTCALRWRWLAGRGGRARRAPDGRAVLLAAARAASTWSARRRSTPRCAAARLRRREAGRGGVWRAALDEGERRGARRPARKRRGAGRAPARTRCATRPSPRGSLLARRRWNRGTPVRGARARSRQRACACRRCRPRPSARSRRPPRSARCAPRLARGETRRGRLRAAMQRLDRRGGRAGRKRSVSTCWCMASSSATTWSSTSASSSRACLHRARLGAELRLALRQAADDLRRRRRARRR